MQFLNPIWLFALAALSIPVIIHLWNIKPGKTLKVGSIALITASAQKSSRSFKLHDILLLILRCLLLALVALLLAGPVWVQKQSTTKVKGWVLIPEEYFKEAYPKFNKEVDSLINAGYEFHYFNKGFKKADLKKLLADTIKIQPEKAPANYWSLIRLLDEQTPNDLPVYIITPNNINHFRGNKPLVFFNLKWQAYIPADSVSTWFERAWFTPDNDIHVVQGNSKPSGTYFTNYTVQSGGDSRFETNVDNGSPIIQLKGKQDMVAIDTTTLHLAVYTDKYSVDANYLKAALQTVGDFSQRKTIIKQYSIAGQISAGQDWLFWLSDKPVDENASKKAKHLFSYAAGKVMSIDTRIKTTGQYAVVAEPEIALFKEIQTKATDQITIWVDGFGNSLLSAQNNNYQFYTHFNPAWNDLVWNDAFPKLLLKLIADNKPSAISFEHDKRILAQEQLMPTIIKETKAAVNKLDIKINLSRYFWLAIVLLFFLERWLAHNKPEVKND